MIIYIMRHGETALNTKGVLQGRLDEPLNENGRALAEVTGRALKGLHFDGCFSSPLNRAMETAEIILRESANDISIAVDERITEISFGAMEGVNIYETGEEGLRLFKDPLNSRGFAGGESIPEVCERTQAFLKELVARDDGKTYLVSTHGCAMRGMINYLLDDPSDFWIGHAPYNCSFTIVDAEGGRARITDIDKIYYDKDKAVDYFK